ncbi:MAG: HRDC domain-containing protein [Verrucomicrobiota bacterium]|nr:HRDC domain-containing protein [Verrucomicrobiota bacterium]
MQFEVFAVPAAGNRDLADALNRFLRSHRVLHVERRLVETGAECVWSFCVEYLDVPVGAAMPSSLPKIDYKAVLTPEQFARFSALRVLRKELADKEAVPPYAIFTNEQLAEMVKLEAPTKGDIQAIPGIGLAKMQKYGDAFPAALSTGAQPGSASGQPEAASEAGAGLQQTGFGLQTGGLFLP